MIKDVGFGIRQMLCISYLLHNKLSPNLAAYNNDNYQLSLMALWVRDSDRAQQRWLVSAPQCLTSQLEDSGTGDWNHLKAHSLSRGLCWSCQLGRLHGPSTQPVLSHNTVTGFHGLAWLKFWQRPWHYDASLKVIPATESRWPEWQKERKQWK